MNQADLTARILHLLGQARGTSADLARRAPASLWAVRKALRVLRQEGRVEKRPRWYGRFSYTWVYRLRAKA